MASVSDNSSEKQQVEQVVEREVEASETPKSWWSRLDSLIELQDADESARRSNRDLDPIPKDRRTWKGWQLACYWGSDMLQASALRTIISLTAGGLSARMALLANTLAYIMMGGLLAANAKFGVKYHVPFTVQSRASFGYYLSYVVVLMRLIVGGVWFATNAYTGAECVRSIIYAIWPSYHNVKNQLPASANITTDLMVCYLIYFIVSLPFFYIRQEKIQWLFTAKTILIPIALFGILGWGVQASTDPNELFGLASTVHGSEFSWAFISALASAISSYATMAVNINDFARYTDDPWAPYIQILVLPIFSIFTSCVGLVMGAASEQVWGTALWDPLLVIDNWTSHGGRAAAFFMALIFLFGQIGVNLSANCTSAANDLNAMLPRYVDIRRGQFIISTVFSWGATPWNMLTGAPAFLNFMDGYTVFLGPMAGILISDIYCVHRNKYDIREFYKVDGAYRYNKLGCNWRAVIAFFCGCIPQLPGFAATINTNIVLNKSVTNFYDLGYFYNFPVPFVVYAALSLIFPPKGTLVLEDVTPDDIDFGKAMSHSEEPIYPEKVDV